MEAHLREVLEQIRGKPILVSEGNPLNVSCAETSDAERLCRHPVVSVHMLAYNHSAYIREAIESVLSQQTEFEFELVIGEDCSQDDTRAICCEYQKKYPDRVRVLWSEKRAGIRENYFRTLSRCRGEFIAFCEGDDYWIDDGRLQRQVDVMRAHPSVGICGARNKVYIQDDDRLVSGDDGVMREGVYSGREIFHNTTDGASINGVKFGMFYFQTSSLLVRRKSLDFAMDKFKEAFSLRLSLCDLLLKQSVSHVSDVWLSNDTVSVYRKNQGGITVRNNSAVLLDATVLRIYMMVVFSGWEIEDAIEHYKRRILLLWTMEVEHMGWREQRDIYKGIVVSKVLKRIFSEMKGRPILFLLKIGCFRGLPARGFRRLYVGARLCRGK